jgi:acetyl esterase
MLEIVGTVANSVTNILRAAMTDALHPQVAALLAAEAASGTALVTLTVEQVRAQSNVKYSPLVGEPETVHRTWGEVLKTTSGDVSVRWYQPTIDEPTLLVVYVHGGGWVTGTLDTYDSLCASLALRSGALVMSVDYGISPETAFPGALAQVTAILAEAREHALNAGFSIQTVSAAGDSAGGQLVGAAIHRLIVAQQPLPDSAVYIYPVTDASMTHRSWTTLGSGYRLTYEKMKWFWEQYLGTDFATMQARAKEPDVSPLYAPTLKQNPRSLVITAAFDPLRDEGDAFATRLKAEGAPVEWFTVPGQVHGFLRLRQAFTDPDWGADAVMKKIGTFLTNV